MATVFFTANLDRHLSCPPTEANGTTVREILDRVFENNHQLAGYILDDQRQLRRHVMVFVDGEMISDRKHLSDPVEPSSEIYVMQALSGGEFA